jgi:hypothetical protein
MLGSPSPEQHNVGVFGPVKWGSLFREQVFRESISFDSSWSASMSSREHIFRRVGRLEGRKGERSERGKGWKGKKGEKGEREQKVGRRNGRKKGRLGRKVGGSGGQKLEYVQRIICLLKFV